MSPKLVKEVLNKHRYLRPFYDLAEFVMQIYDEQLDDDSCEAFIPTLFSYFTVTWANIDEDTRLELETKVLEQLLGLLYDYRSRKGPNREHTALNKRITGYWQANQEQVKAEQ